jgi:LysM repeat protein
MKENTKTTNTKNRKRSKMTKLFARTPSMAASVTRERDWKTDVPNIKLSRAFVVVLVIHVVALGGILAFEMFKPKESAVLPTAVNPHPGRTDLEELAKTRPAVEDNRGVQRDHIKHKVNSGERIETIAQKYGVSREDITRLNTISDAYPLRVGRVLSIPNNGTMPLPSNVVATEKPKTTLRTPANVPSADPVIPAAIPAVEAVPGAEIVTEADDFAPIGNLLSEFGGTPEDFDTVPAPEISPKIDDEFSSWNKGPEIVRPTSAEEFQPVAPKEKSRATVVRSLPAAPSAPRKAEAVAAPATSGSKVHTVQAGETLYAIGRKYGVSVAAIQKANQGLDPSRIGIGAQLRIPR